MWDEHLKGWLTAAQKKGKEEAEAGEERADIARGEEVMEATVVTGETTSTWN